MSTATQPLHELYTTISQESQDGHVYARVRLNAKHAVYQGHFPDQPITPGVCLLEIMKNILATHLQKRLRMISCNSIKFIRLIDPNETPIINFCIKCPDPTEIIAAKISVVGDTDQQTYCKFVGTFAHQ